MGKFVDYLCEAVDQAERLELPNVALGDEIRIGKFKNRTAIVTGFSTDKHGQPILLTNKGSVTLFKPRLVKLMKDEVEEDAMPRVIIDKGW